MQADAPTPGGRRPDGRAGSADAGGSDLVEAAVGMLLAGAPVGYAVLDTELRYVRINQTLAAVNGVPVAEHLGRSVAEVLPDVAPEVEPLLRRVLATGEPITDLELDSGPTPGQPGRRRHWRVSYYPVRATPGAGPPEGLGLVVTDETGRHEGQEERRRLLEAERTAAARVRHALQRQERLHRLTSALARATTVRDVAATMVDLAPGILGASAATLNEYEPGTGLSVLAVSGLPPEVARPGQVIPAPLPPLVRDVLRGDGPVLVASTAERDRRYPDMAGSGVRQQAWANLALCSHGRPAGIVAFGWDDPRTFADEDVELLTALADQCATAMDRARLYRAEQDARRRAETAQQRLDLLARAGYALSRSLDESAVLDELAALLVPDHADWLVVLLAGRPGQLVPRCSVHADPRVHAAAQELLAARPLRVDGHSAAARVFRTQRPLVVEDALPYLTEDGGPPEVARFARLLGPGPGLLTPLVVRGRSTGVLSLVGASAGGRPLTDQQELVGDLASRVAVALDNAHLYGRQTRIARRLQDGLLPARLPEVPGVELATRYATAEESVEVGGDFYDVVPLDGGAFVLAIGDVCGRGIDAASTTGLARHTLRAIARDLPPAAALVRLNEALLAETAPDRFLTAACARITPHPDGTAAVQLARAGHEPPVLVRADGSATLLAPAGQLLGVLPEVIAETRELVLGPGDALVMYTDGITETRGRDGLFGEERLVAALAGPPGPRPAAVPPRTADDLADLVLAATDRFRAGPADDDAALLVARLRPR
ncbi:SpoIIE family protein phosphatase [Geodermatophilus sp. SYSU D00525]